MKIAWKSWTSVGEAMIFRDRGDVVLPIRASCSYSGLFHVINRCFQILHSRTEITWRQHSDLVIEPDVRGMEWDAFDSAAQLVKAGEEAAGWLCRAFALGSKRGRVNLASWSQRVRPLAHADGG
jgi:hypothetical protein